MSEGSDRLYQRARQLAKTDEWAGVKEYAHAVADVHRMDASNLIAKGKTKDAERQAWIAEGIEEMLAMPEEIVSEHESAVGKVREFCALCGQKFIAAVNRFPGR